MNIVVTGGAGFIGSNLLEYIKDLGKITVIDNLSTGKIKNINAYLDDVSFLNEDINDLQKLKTLFQNIDLVFHLAAITSVNRSVLDPLTSNPVNITGTLNVLSAAKDNGVKKVIYASSSSVYGDTPTLPKKEDMKPNPQSPYAVSKLAGEYYCKVFSKIYDLETVCLRFFNVYGPKQNACSEYSAVIPIFISKLLDGCRPVIYGDGEQTRDFSYVRDVVDAIIQAMKPGVKGIINIAGGRRTSIKELLDLLINISGIKVEPIYKEPRQGDVRDSFADISKARKIMGYNPKFSLEEGLRETLKWYQSY
jgi:UDP-glucose 4-epimerase